ncbi:hypothetical protein DEA98_14105 [Brucella pseudogrignonensis]|nr:hypothetical protein [Brucella pseudogrignonensis]
MNVVGVLGRLEAKGRQLPPIAAIIANTSLRRSAREKIARYREEYPERYRVHRNKENELRAQARSALKLIKEIETKGLEALL